jgi:small-conductance mechanosensitive channel
MQEILDTERVKIIETAILLVIVLLVKISAAKGVNRILAKLDFDPVRKTISQKIINLFIVILLFFGLAGIWNIDQKELIVFFTSVITLLGIAFFAQWSLLSNITSSLILFFNHPLKIGQDIEILDKDYPIQGKLEDISFFFLHIRTPENEHITIPNNVIMQRTLLIKDYTRKASPTEKQEKNNN